MTNPSQHLCYGLDTITVDIVGTDVLMHIGRDVTSAPACVQVKMCVEFALQLAANLQYTTAFALAPLFENDPAALKELMTNMYNDAQAEVIRMHERRGR